VNYKGSQKHLETLAEIVTFSVAIQTEANFGSSQGVRARTV